MGKPITISLWKGKGVSDGGRKARATVKPDERVPPANPPRETGWAPPVPK
jgi:hypothetical protein